MSTLASSVNQQGTHLTTIYTSTGRRLLSRDPCLDDMRSTAHARGNPDGVHKVKSRGYFVLISLDTQACAYGAQKISSLHLGFNARNLTDGGINLFIQQQL